jgi:phosphatidate cytidylyltransferase
MLLGYWLVDLPWAHGVVLGVLVATVAPFGDLAKSMVKRQMKVKDFSVLIPGHGGMFDRIDSLLFVVPVVYYYLTLVLG